MKTCIFPIDRKPIIGSVVFLASMWLMAATVAQAAWKSVSPDSTAERVRLVVISEQEVERPLRGIWTVLEPGQELVYSLSGEGQLRLESRPLFQDSSDSDSYWLNIAIGDSVRLFNRSSGWEHNVFFRKGDHSKPGEIRTVVGVGEVDQLGLEWQADIGTLTIRNQAQNNRRILCRVLLSEGVSKIGRREARQLSKGLDQSMGFELDAPSIGWDSNALLVPKDEPGVETEAEWFLPVDFRIYFDKDLHSRTSVQAKYIVIGSLYDDTVLNSMKHRVKLGGETRLGSQRSKQGVDLFYNYRFTYKDDTFNGRGDREEFETTDPVTGQPIPMGNRFDYNEHRLQGGLRKHLGRRVETKLSVSGLVKDYINDFEDYPDIYSLDQDQMKVQLALTGRILRKAKLSGRVSYRAKNYDEKFSRDLDGNEVMKIPTSLRNADFILTGEYGRGAGPRVHAEMKIFNSRDQYAGYWDYSGVAIEGGVGWRWKAGHMFSARVRHSQKDYDNAYLNYDSSLSLREKSVLNLRVTGKYVFSRRIEAFFKYHYKDADNNNTDFAYLRTFVIAGLTFQL